MNSALVLMVSLWAAAQSAGDPCTSGAPELCSGDQILVCDGSTYQTLSCPALVPGSTCSPDACTGPCEGFARCTAPRNGRCLGAGPVLDDDDTNDNRFMAVVCEAGDACAIDFATNQESCRASPGGVVCDAQSSAQCVGDDLVFCVSLDNGTDAIAAPAVLRCATEGATCEESADGPHCVLSADPRCGGDLNANTCADGVRVVCVDGVVEEQEDCLTRGQACVIDNNAGVCVTPDPECGALGLGVCAGNQATICDGGQLTSTVDCASLGRRCGAVDATGLIGCVVGAGEGEGEPECESDDDCDDDEECDDGECRSDRTRSDEPATLEPAPLFSCAQTGASALSMAGALAGLVLVIARRRR